MNLNKSLSVAVFALLAAGYGAGKADAQTFAVFNDASFAYTGGTLSAYSATPTFQPTFTFSAGAFAGDTVDATVTLSATASGSAITPIPEVIIQNLTGLTASFTAVTPIDGKSNLLTVSGASAVLEYDSFTGTATFDASSLTLSSDFYSFSGPNDLTFNFVPTTTPTVVGGVLQNFTDPGTGNGTVTTASSSAVPEPGTISMLVGLAVTGSGLSLRRLRRRNA